MNYMGSKQKISKYIVPIIQKYIDDSHASAYVEPFVGGASIIDKIKCRCKYGLDINKYLIALFWHIQDGGILPDVITKTTYDKARAAWHKDNVDHEFEDWEIGCAGWLCSVNGRGFSGGYSFDGIETRKDGTKIPRFYYRERKDNLIKQASSPGWKEIDFEVSNYSHNIFAPHSVVVYCDPPYENVKQYEYGKDFDYEEFWCIMRKWSKDNIVLISELQAPDDFECIWSQEVSRSINAQNKTRAVEKLFKWKGE